MNQFSYTYKSIAHASGRTANNVRVDASRGKVDPEDLRSVSVYVVTGILEKEKEQGDGSGLPA